MLEEAGETLLMDPNEQVTLQWVKCSLLSTISMIKNSTIYFRK